jgi:hypothetical protein
MRWIEAASAGTPARAQPAPPLIRLWRFPCPFQRRTAERYKGAAISVLTLPCQDGTDSSNPLSSRRESRANSEIADELPPTLENRSQGIDHQPATLPKIYPFSMEVSLTSGGWVMAELGYPSVKALTARPLIGSHDRGR